MRFFVVLLFFVTQAYALPVVKKGQPLPSDIFIELAKTVNPYVVNISTSYLPKNNRKLNDPFLLFFQELYGGQFQVQNRPQNALGSGFVIRKDGLILTNNHVVEKADVINVQFIDEKEKFYKAKVIGRDRRSDLALIKVTGKKIKSVAKLGSSKALEVGEWVTAFGNPYGHSNTMTKGIVSAIGRELKQLNSLNFIQIDASINPGNSGGPLVNLRGEVVGINTAVLLGNPRFREAQGIAFAIPIDYVKKVLPELEKNGFVRRGYIGVSLGNLNPDLARYLKLKNTKGTVVTKVEPNSPAEKAGLKPYDVIIRFNGRKVNSSLDLINAAGKTRNGEVVRLTFLRNKKRRIVKVRLTGHPEDILRSPVTRTPPARNSTKLHGLEVSDYSKSLSRKWGIGPLPQKKPIVVGVENKAKRSGLFPGDVILDVNQRPVFTAQQVHKYLRKGKNILRILRQGQVFILYLEIH